MAYKIQIYDREYKKWTFIHPETGEPKHLADSESLINPVHLKMFSGDLVNLSTLIPSVIHSPTKSNPIPGILILEDNQTYGRTTNQKRLLYKCIPNDKHLPAFLIPYSPDIKFTKTQKNRYVVFQFDNWNSKFPYGILTENLGEIDSISAFCQYQLYCKGLQANINEFTSATKLAIKSLPITKDKYSHFFQETPHSTKRVFSIDPEGARDLDDAFAVFQDSHSVVTIRVYIANVYAWIETLGLWKDFGERVSTIYLPDSRRTMLPPILSESMCSLIADGTYKPTICMEVRVDLNNPIIIPGSIRVFSQPVKINTNFSYESKSLLDDNDYKLLYKCSKLLDPDIYDSHNVVEFWMTKMNSICGKMLYQKGVGIFREVSINSLEEQQLQLDSMPPNTKTLLKNWRNTPGQYRLFNKDTEIIHSAMKKESYVHITSPIRRLVDLLNQIILYREFGTSSTQVRTIIPFTGSNDISSDAKEFVDMWKSRLHEINTKMRYIKKVQIDCDLLYRCNVHPEWMQHTHQGIIFERVQIQDGIYSYIVHLSHLNILGRIVTNEKYVNYQSLEFRIFVFKDADTLYKKIRITVA
jgi:exoribonuclease R